MGGLSALRYLGKRSADADAYYGLSYTYPTSVSGVASTYNWPSVSGLGFSSTTFGARGLRYLGKRSADADADADAYYYGGYAGYGYSAPAYGAYALYSYGYRFPISTSYEARSPQGLSALRYGYRFW